MAVSKSVRFLPSITPFAGVRGSSNRGACVPPSGAPTACRMAGSTTSDFVLPGTNPFSLFQRPLRGLRGRQPPGTPPGTTRRRIQGCKSTPRENGWRTNLEATSPLASLLQLWNTIPHLEFPYHYTDIGTHYFKIRLYLHQGEASHEIDKRFSAFIEPLKVIRNNL